MAAHYILLNFRITAAQLLKSEASKEALSVLMLRMPSNCLQPFSYNTKLAAFEYFGVLSVSL